MDIPQKCQFPDWLPNNYQKRRPIMANQDVLYTKEDNIIIITPNRPQKLNTLTHEMLGSINSIIVDIEKDDEIRAVMLTGVGRTFSVGTDISGEVPQTAEVEINLMNERISTQYRRSPGLKHSEAGDLRHQRGCRRHRSRFSLRCDIRIAAESAYSQGGTLGPA
jgi:hypothetical protein